MVAAALAFKIHGVPSYPRAVFSSESTVAAGVDCVWTVEIRGVVHPQSHERAAIGTGCRRIPTKGSQAILVTTTGRADGPGALGAVALRPSQASLAQGMAVAACPLSDPICDLDPQQLAHVNPTHPVISFQ